MVGIENTEKFSNETEVVKTFDNIFAEDVKNVKDSIKSLTNQIKDSKYLSDLIFDSNLFEFSELFAKDFFNNIYRVIESYSTLGTHEALIQFIGNIFGTGTTVSFSSNATFDLILSITSPVVTGGNLITVDEDNIITEDGDNIVYSTNRLGYTQQQLIDLISKFIPIGIRYKIIFNL